MRSEQFRGGEWINEMSERLAVDLREFVLRLGCGQWNIFIETTFSVAAVVKAVVEMH